MALIDTKDPILFRHSQVCECIYAAYKKEINCDSYYAMLTALSTVAQ